MKGSYGNTLTIFLSYATPSQPPNAPCPRQSFLLPLRSGSPMAAKILNLVAISSLAILACSFGATPANALSIDTTPNFARHFPHHGAALKKRATSRRCKPRSSSLAGSSTKVSATPSSTKAVVPTTTPKADPKPTSTKPKATPTPAPVSNSGGGGGKAGLGWANGDDSSLKNFVSSKVR